MHQGEINTPKEAAQEMNWALKVYFLGEKKTPIKRKHEKIHMSYVFGENAKMQCEITPSQNPLI